MLLCVGGVDVCGVIGYVSSNPTHDQTDALMRVIRESKIRGLHAFGMSHVAYDDKHVEYVEHVKFPTLDGLLGYMDGKLFWDAIAHTRYSTSGDWKNMANNQPIVVDGWSLVFNGVISMKTKEEMEEEYNIKLTTYNDGEIFLRHVMNGKDPIEFVRTMKGSFAGLWYTPQGWLYAIRNERRPMWWVRYDDSVFVASTRDIIARALGHTYANSAVECEPNRLYDLEELL